MFLGPLGYLLLRYFVLTAYADVILGGLATQPVGVNVFSVHRVVRMGALPRFLAVLYFCWHAAACSSDGHVSVGSYV